MRNVALLSRCALWVLWVSLFACTEAPAPLYSALGQNLLARSPDAVIEQRGVLVPTADEGFGSSATVGVEGRTRRGPGGAAFAWCTQPVARLRLGVLDPVEREVVVDLRAPDGRAGAATVRLNGHLLGTLELSSEPVAHRLQTPAAMWFRGDNVLELEFESVHRVDEELFAAAALYSIEYAPEVRASVDAKGASARLESGTGLRYRLELLAPSALSVQGVSGGPGAVELRFVDVDPETGIADEALATNVEVPVEEGELRAELELPDPGEAVLEVELSWRGEGTLDLSGLHLTEETPAPRPPIVFISIDTLSARNMSLYGHVRQTTPSIDAFAREAVVFEEARANAPFTLQSYMSQLSGLYPSAHRIDPKKLAGRAPSPWEKDQLASNRWTMAEMLRAAGYRTAAWVDNPWLARGFGFTQGFDTYDTSASEIVIQDPSGGIEHIASEVAAYLDTIAEDEPLFLFIQAMDPHGPYIPAARFDGVFQGDEHHVERQVPVGFDQLHAYGLIPEYIARGPLPLGNFPETMDAGYFEATYDERILQTDTWVGVLLDDLRARGIFDEALIILSADHGESLLDHDYYFDHGTLYDEVLHVPLIVRLPGGEHGGARVATPAQLVDLLPTMADWLGIPTRRFLHGRSLVPAMRGDGLGDAPILGEGGLMTQATVVDEGWKLIETSPATAALQTMITHPRAPQELLRAEFPELSENWYKESELLELFESRRPAKREFIQSLRGPFYELYDTDADPAEAHDLAEREPERLAEMLELLRRVEARGIRAKGQARLNAPPAELTPEQKNSLMDLGYLEDSE